MSDLPPGWSWATLEDLLAAEERPITDGPFGSKLASRHYTGSGARVIRLQNIGDGFFRDEHAYISLDYFKELRDHEVRAGDLILASLGEELPKACIMPDLGVPAIVKADCIRARIHPEINTRWVLYALMAPATREWAASRIKGIGRPRLGLAGIRAIPLPVPSLAEQGRIVAALEDYFSRLDVGGRLAGSASHRCELLVSRVRDECVERFAGTMRSLGSILREPLANGRSVPTEEGGFPVLRLTALRNGMLDISQRKGGRWTATEAAPFLVQEGDFFISRGSGSLNLVGRGGLLEMEPDPVAFPDTMVRVRVDRKQMLPQFLRLIWDSYGVRKQIESVARTTAGIYKINQSMIEAIKIPVPEIEVQRETITAIQQKSEAKRS